MPEVTLAVTGMSCGHCAKAVTDALQSVPGVIRVDVSLEEGTATMEVDDATARKRIVMLWIMVVAGIAGLGIGGMLFVDGARTIARALGVSEAVIGLTVVALGTSLPELLTSVVAAARGHADISLGNIVGSNIFNILLVIGATASIKPYSISVDPYLSRVGMPFMIVLAVILVPIALTGRRINRLEGAFLSIVYAAYIALAVVMR